MITPLYYLKALDEQDNFLNKRLECCTEDVLGNFYTQLDEIETDRYVTKASLVLSGLGISPAPRKSPMQELSGGIRVRIALALALLQLQFKINHIVVPKNVACLIQDPSLKLTLKQLDFNQIMELDEIEYLIYPMAS